MARVGFDIEDNCHLQIDEIIVGVGEEGLSLVRAGPLRVGIARPRAPPVSPCW